MFLHSILGRSNLGFLLESIEGIVPLHAPFLEKHQQLVPQPGVDRVMVSFPVALVVQHTPFVLLLPSTNLSFFFLACVIYPLFVSLEIKSIVKLKKNVAEKERERERR